MDGKERVSVAFLWSDPKNWRNDRTAKHFSSFSNALRSHHKRYEFNKLEMDANEKVESGRVRPITAFKLTWASNAKSGSVCGCQWDPCEF
jgi:hypothetical protein